MNFSNLKIIILSLIKKFAQEIFKAPHSWGFLLVLEKNYITMGVTLIS